MTVADFIAKWRHHELKERSAAQEHFIDLCRLVGHPTPIEADPEGRWFMFERGASKAGGGDGWADAWKRDHFGWEYKGRQQDLGAAYRQLLLYFGALENPPLLVTCDTDRIVIHTHFPGTPTQAHELSLEGLADPSEFGILQAVFHEPSRLRPAKTVQAITEEAAGTISEIAQALRRRGVAPERVARFLDRIVFCLFAEDVGLLPPRLFTRVIENTTPNPGQFKAVVGPLFAAMATGGNFGAERIAHFNGDLFQDGDVLDVTAEEMRLLHGVTALDWSSIDASIFGTLFERALDPDKRTQLGAHYTSREDIEALVEPVVMAPLRAEWLVLREELTRSLEQDSQKSFRPSIKRWKGSPAQQQASKLLRGFLDRLQAVTVLDPACGSGNFLFVTLQKIKDLEKEVIVFAATVVGGLFPRVHPRQLHGIELNKYAHELAQMTVWIGYLQWVKKNGFGDPSEPILERLSTFECKDAVLAIDAGGDPAEPTWPAAEFIVGNPPFLGGKRMRDSLGDEYVEALFRVWRDRVPAESDYCCYWFEKARKQIEAGATRRAGLLATQAIRGGVSRTVLKRIQGTGQVFFAISDRDWVLDGADVHVSMIGFDDGTEARRILDGHPVPKIYNNLTSTVDVTQARRLLANKGIAFMGDTKGGNFELPEQEAFDLLDQPNPNGRPNSDVLVPWANGRALTRDRRRFWIIDYGTDLNEKQAAQYERPFALAETRVKQDRLDSKTTIDRWWRHERPRVEMRAALAGATRYLVSPRVGVHRLFLWVDAPTLPDSATFVFANADDYMMGILHSRVHEVWARSQATQVRERESGTRYTPRSCFETFPLPLHADPDRVALAAKKLHELRARWLNPPEFTHLEGVKFRASRDSAWGKFIGTPAEDGFGTVNYERPIPNDAGAERLWKKRTLTALYTERPTWLKDAHSELDAEVSRLYGLASDASVETILEHLLVLNLERAEAEAGRCDLSSDVPKEMDAE